MTSLPMLVACCSDTSGAPVAAISALQVLVLLSRTNSSCVVSVLFRTYQQYIEDALSTILHGKPAGVGDVLKRAFSASSETSFLDAATAAASAAAGAPAAAITAALAATTAPLAAPAAPAATSAIPARRSASVASSLSSAEVAAAAKRSMSVASTPGTDSASQPEAPSAAGSAEAANGAATQQARPADTGGEARDKADVPTATDIAAEVYRLHLGGDGASTTGEAKRPGMCSHALDITAVLWPPDVLHTARR